MIDMALLSVIRRWHLRDGHSIREIARRTGLSRNKPWSSIMAWRPSKRMVPATLENRT